MKTEIHETMRSKWIKIFPFADRPESELITVYIQKSWVTGEYEPATINWSAIGETSQHNTKLFADGLALALELANNLDEEFGLITPAS